MKQYKIAILVAVMMILFFLAAGNGWSNPWKAFGFEEKDQSRGLKLKFPNVPLKEKEKKKLYEGKPIAKLLSGEEGLKTGYLRFFAPFDPITAWMVVTDEDHLALVDPAFPKAGSLTQTRRSYMPYVFDCATCKEKGEDRMYQLLVMPLVAPRRLCVKRSVNTAAFPYETFWEPASDQLCCESKMNPEMEKYYDKAVFLKRNSGAWHISPLPKEFRKTAGDIMRADCIYYVDTNPGGDLGKLKAIINKATSVALPKMMDNVIFHGKRWEIYLNKIYGAAMVAKWKKWQAEYKAAMGTEVENG